MVNDPIGDSLARINNAITRGREDLMILYSRLNEEICRVLKEDKRISSYEVKSIEGKDWHKQIMIRIDKREDLKPINSVKRVSKPGLRIYRGYKEIKPVLNGYGTAIISTPKGMMSDENARKNKVGGEIICEIK